MHTLSVVVMVTAVVSAIAVVALSIRLVRALLSRRALVPVRVATASRTISNNP